MFFLTVTLYGGVVKYEGEALKNFGNKLEKLSTNKQFTVQEILNSNEFEICDNGVLNLGVSNDIHWVKFNFINKSGKLVLMDIPFPVIDEFNVYLINPEGNIIDSSVSGVSQMYSNRKINHQDFIT